MMPILGLRAPAVVTAASAAGAAAGVAPSVAEGVACVVGSVVAAVAGAAVVVGRGVSFAAEAGAVDLEAAPDLPLAGASLKLSFCFLNGKHMAEWRRATVM
jgi:hypothetical protein